MTFNDIIDECDCVNYKIAKTNRQSCLFCGRAMVEGDLGISITNSHMPETKDKKMKASNLWIHGVCRPWLGGELRNEKHEDNRRINLKKCTSTKQWCVCCGCKITKSIQIEFNNSSDANTTKKTIWMHKKCAKKLGQGFHWKIRNLPYN